MSFDKWEKYKLGEVTIWKSGGTPPKMNDNFWDGDIPWISAKNLVGNRIYDSNVKITEEGLQKGSKLANINSILLLVRGSGLFNRIPVAIVKKPVAFNQDIKEIIAIKEVLSPEFLLYWFESITNILGNKLEETGIGAGKFDTEILKNLEIYIPTFYIQESIISKIRAIDDKIELNRQTNKTLETIAQALFKEMCLPKGEELLEGWIVGRLKDVLEIKYGKDHKHLGNGSIPLYGSGGIMRHVDKALYENESILIPRKGTLSNLFYINKPFWSVDTMFYSIIKKQYHGKFLFHLLQSLNLASMNVGSAVPSLTTEILNNIEINIPPQNILKEFDDLVTPIFQNIEANEDESNTLATLRDSLLPRLMKGEIEL